MGDKVNINTHTKEIILENNYLGSPALVAMAQRSKGGRSFEDTPTL